MLGCWKWKEVDRGTYDFLAQLFGECLEVRHREFQRRGSEE